MIKEFISNLIRQKQQTANWVLIMLIFTQCTTFSFLLIYAVLSKRSDLLEFTGVQSIAFNQILTLVLGYVLAKRISQDDK
jgi:threonine/homoserine/homoserine lactone efflux protein